MFFLKNITPHEHADDEKYQTLWPQKTLKSRGSSRFQNQNTFKFILCCYSNYLRAKIFGKKRSLTLIVRGHSAITPFAIKMRSEILNWKNEKNIIIRDKNTTQRSKMQHKFTSKKIKNWPKSALISVNLAIEKSSRDTSSAKAATRRVEF